jgi:hypothetical protein
LGSDELTKMQWKCMQGEGAGVLACAVGESTVSGGVGGRARRALGGVSPARASSGGHGWAGGWASLSYDIGI